MLMPGHPPVFDCHLHYFAKDTGNLKVITDLLDKGFVEGILCCTDLYVKPSDAIAVNKPLFEAASRYSRQKLPLLATVHPSMSGWKDMLSSMLDVSPQIVGIKLHPPVGHYTVNLETVSEVFEIAEKKKF